MKIVSLCTFYFIPKFLNTSCVIFLISVAVCDVSQTLIIGLECSPAYFSSVRRISNKIFITDC